MCLAHASSVPARGRALAGGACVVRVPVCVVTVVCVRDKQSERGGPAQPSVGECVHVRAIYIYWAPECLKKLKSRVILIFLSGAAQLSSRNLEENADGRGLCYKDRFGGSPVHDEHVPHPMHRRRTMCTRTVTPAAACGTRATFESRPMRRPWRKRFGARHDGSTQAPSDSYRGPGVRLVQQAHPSYRD
jgi:hypothetical protein